MTKTAHILRRPLAVQGEAGLSILEMLIAAAIVSTSGYFTFLAIGKNMTAKKDVEIANYASQFEEPMRYAIPLYAMEKAETTCLNGASPILDKQLSSEYTFKRFQANAAVFSNAPAQWRKAAARCQNPWSFRAAEQTAHGCYVLAPTANHRKKDAIEKANDPFDPDFVFVEVLFSLYDLAKEQNYATCTPSQNRPPAGIGSSLTIPATEYTGNTNRGYKMLYTIYAYKKGGENRRRYDETSGVKIAGANFHPDYCTTRNALAAKAPGANGRGKCDFIVADLAHSVSTNPKIEIPRDALDAFYPPPPDPCERNPSLEQCQVGAGSGGTGGRAKP